MEFPKLKLARSCALCLSNDPVYVLLFATQEQKSDKEGLFAAALSGSNEIKVYSQDSFCCQCSLTGHEGRVTSIKFDKRNSNIIWSSSLDGSLRYWDIQEKNQNEGKIFSQNEVGYSALDINCTGTILAAGTENLQTENEEKEVKRLDVAVVVEFWDISDSPNKSPVCLCKFDSLHSDDITSIAFHPINPNTLMTGSTDGLVAVVDMTSQDEDTALLRSLNTESSVSTMGYFGPSNEFAFILTHIETFTIWNYMEGELLTSIMDIKKRAVDCKNIDYVIDCVYHNLSERLFLIGGTQDGKIEVLHINLDTIEPYFSLHGGHSSIVRCVLYRSNALLTGAEDGMVCSWMSSQSTEEESEVGQRAVAKKAPKVKHTEKKKPYKSK